MVREFLQSLIYALSAVPRSRWLYLFPVASSAALAHPQSPPLCLPKVFPLCVAGLLTLILFVRVKCSWELHIPSRPSADSDCRVLHQFDERSTRRVQPLVPRRALQQPVTVLEARAATSAKGAGIAYRFRR